MQLSKRMVKPDYWTDTELIKLLPPAGRMLYQGLWHLAESSGVIEADPFAYKMLLFSIDDIEVSVIKKWVDILVESKKLIPFIKDNKKYYFLKNFHKHQALRSPGKPELPLPDFVEYIENEEKYKSGGYIINYDMIENGNCSGIKIIGNIKECIREQYKNGTVSLKNEYGRDSATNKNKKEKENIEKELEEEYEVSASTTERQILKILKTIINYPYDYETDINHIRDLKTDYPEVDLLNEIKKWKSYKQDNPLKKKSNPRLQLRNWMSNASDWNRDNHESKYSDGESSELLREKRLKKQMERAEKYG